MSRRSKDSWARLLIYVVPALMDTVVGQVFFINTVRVAKMTTSALLVTGVLLVWNAAYGMTAPLVGRFVTVRSSAAIVVTSCVAFAVVCGMCPFAPGLIGVYAMTALGGVVAAVFFVTFQVFMKAVGTAGGKSVAYSTGLYTFSWSTGLAIGPLVSGFLMEMGSVGGGVEAVGWKYAYGVGALVSLLSGTGVYLLKHLAHSSVERVAPPPVPARNSPCDYSRLPDLAWLGWIGGAAGIVSITLIRGVFPAFAGSVLRLPDSSQGLVFFALAMAQALTGLALRRSRMWMYRGWAVGVFGLIGVAALLGFAAGRTLPALCFAAIACGIYSGSFSFYMVFHALTHPTRSGRYVSVNETIMGAGGIAGAFFGGALADAAGARCAYGAVALVVGAVTAFQMAMHRRKAYSLSPGEGSPPGKPHG